jgi:hypothetical protein
MYGLASDRWLGHASDGKYDAKNASDLAVPQRLLAFLTIGNSELLPISEACVGSIKPPTWLISPKKARKMNISRPLKTIFFERPSSRLVRRKHPRTGAA